MMDDRLSGPKPDALPGCATPRLARSLEKPAIERNPFAAFHGIDRQNMAGTGNKSPGIVPDLNVIAIPSHMAARVVVQRHYLHRRPPISFAFGIISTAWEIVGVITFGTPASRHMMTGACPSEPESVIELNRLWCSDELPRNTESQFIAKALAMLPPRIVLSYADTAQGHSGIVYRAANFHYAGWTDMDRKTPRLDYHPASDNTPDAFGYVAPMKHTRDASRSGSVRQVRRKPKAKYWITTGDRRDRKRLTRLCAWPSFNWKVMPIPMDCAA